MPAIMHVLLLALLGNCFLLIQAHRNPDYLAKFFRTKNPDDLHDEAKAFLLLWRNQQQSKGDG